MNQTELQAELEAIAAQNEKARAEILANIAVLEAAIVAAGNTSEGVNGALAVLKASVQADDDLNADVTPDPVP